MNYLTKFINDVKSCRAHPVTNETLEHCESRKCEDCSFRLVNQDNDRFEPLYLYRLNGLIKLDIL